LGSIQGVSRGEIGISPNSNFTLEKMNVRAVAGRPGVSDRGKPSKFAEAAEWTGGFADGDDAGARFRCPGGVCEAQDGTLYVSDAYNHCIRKRAPGAAAWTTLCGRPGEKGVADGQGEAARLSYPQRIALDASGNLVVAGGGSHALHLVTPVGAVRYCHPHGVACELTRGVACSCLAPHAHEAF